MTIGERSELRRIPERGSHEWAVIAEVLDAGVLASVGFSVAGQPIVIPMIYGRDGDRLYLHGATASRLMTTLEAGAPVCVSVTLVDGLVLARSAFHHSMNYRSVVVFGVARPVLEPRRKIEALRVISEHLVADRWADVRGPNKTELDDTMVLELQIEDASAKTRQGGPADDAADLSRPTWAGVLPLEMVAGQLQPDLGAPEGVAVPAYLRGRSWPLKRQRVDRVAPLEPK